MKLNTLTTLVQGILESKPQARESDSTLYYFVLKHIGSTHNIDIDTMSMPRFLLHLKEYPFPTIESVGRCRRKVVENNPDLAGSKTIQKIRAEKEQEYREYARGDAS